MPISDKMKNKRATSFLWQAVLVFVITAAVILVLVFIYNKFIREETSETSKYLTSTGDYDGDNVANLFDKCKCTRAFTDNGCPGNVNTEIKGYNPCSTCPTEEIKKELC